MICKRLCQSVYTPCSSGLLGDPWLTNTHNHPPCIHMGNCHRAEDLYCAGHQPQGGRWQSEWFESKNGPFFESKKYAHSALCSCICKIERGRHSMHSLEGSSCSASSWATGNDGVELWRFEREGSSKCIGVQPL